MVLPGGRFIILLKNNGRLLPESCQDYSQYAYKTLPLSTNDLSGGQVLAFRDHAFDAYCKNLAYLNMIRSKFGEHKMNHSVDMAKGSLQRKYTEL